jgi:hypothetical protein
MMPSPEKMWRLKSYAAGCVRAACGGDAASSGRQNAAGRRVYFHASPGAPPGACGTVPNFPQLGGANGSESQKTALKVLTSCLMPHSFIVEAKPLECGSAAAAFTAIANTGIRPKAAAARRTSGAEPHSKAPFGRSLAFDSHFRLHPQLGTELPVSDFVLY